MTITIWHNPACGTSRNVLALIRASGVEPTVVEYLKTGWEPVSLARLAELSGEGLRGLLRVKGTAADDLGLTDPAVPDQTLLYAMVEHPNLVNRPLVETDRGVRLCRPSERVLDLLDHPPATCVKEDGEVIGG